MLAYAANRPPVVDRRPHPNTLLFIIGAHIAVVALVMSAKMELSPPAHYPRTIVDFIPLPKQPPAPRPATARVSQPLQPRQIDHVRPTVLTPPMNNPPVAVGLEKIDPVPAAGTGTAVIPEIPRPIASAARSGPQLITSGSELKPPYPSSKLLNEEEAVLRLKLTISDQGRVVAVEPVGTADAAFLDAARRHLIAHWRFKPAIEDGHAVSSTTVVTIHFQLDA
jgi:protein TonB